MGTGEAIAEVTCREGDTRGGFIVEVFYIQLGKELRVLAAGTEACVCNNLREVTIQREIKERVNCLGKINY